MQQLGYLWAVTGVVWVGTLIYIVSILRRQTRLSKEIQALEARLTDLNKR